MYNSQGTLNQVTLLGRLGQDPEMRYTPTGTAVLKMSIATQSRLPKDGQWTTITVWHRVVMFGRNAEYWGARLKKGMVVQTTGSLLNREFTDKDGTKHRWNEIRTAEVQCLSKFENPDAHEMEHVPLPEEAQEQTTEQATE